MANSNAMERSDADKNHVGASMFVLDSNGDVGKVSFKGKIAARVNFDGTLSTITPRASDNVSSITDRGVGLYTINFASALPNADYHPMVSIGSNVGYPIAVRVGGTVGDWIVSTTQLGIETLNAAATTYIDPTNVNAIIVL